MLKGDSLDYLINMSGMDEYCLECLPNFGSADGLSFRGTMFVIKTSIKSNVNVINMSYTCEAI